MQALKHLAIAALCTLALAGARAQPSAAANAALTPAHSQALREVIESAGLVDLQLDALRRYKLPPEKVEMANHFLAAATRDKAFLLTIPVMARHLDERQASTLASLSRPRPMRLANRYAVDRQLGRNPVQPLFTRAEAAQIKAANEDPATRHFLARIKPLQDDLSRAWTDWILAHERELERQAQRAMWKGMDDVRAAGARAGSQEIRLDTVGISYLDQLNRVYIALALKSNAAERKFDQAIEASGMDQILVPANLAERAGIERSKKTIAAVDAMLETYLREVDDAQKQCESELRAIAMPNKAARLAATDSGLLGNYTHLIKFGEVQRGILDVFRRFVALAESRAGQLSVVDGKLIFPSDADLALANALSEELQAGGNAAIDLAARRKQTLADARKPI